MLATADTPQGSAIAAFSINALASGNIFNAQPISAGAPVAIFDVPGVDQNSQFGPTGAYTDHTPWPSRRSRVSPCRPWISISGTRRPIAGSTRATASTTPPATAASAVSIKPWSAEASSTILRKPWAAPASISAWSNTSRSPIISAVIRTSPATPSTAFLTIRLSRILTKAAAIGLVIQLQFSRRRYRQPGNEHFQPVRL